MRAMSCTGTGSIMSISPDSSAATRVDALPIGVKTTSVDVAFDLVPVGGVATQHRADAGSRDLQAERPGAVGLERRRVLDALALVDRRSALVLVHHFFGMMHQLHDTSGRIGFGASVTIMSTVWSSTLRTSLIEPT